jgi:uncharacterized membrane protein YuzA (DUF378 family)
MRTFDIVAAILLVVGGLNWGLVGAFQFDLVQMLFGATFLTSLVYMLVGVAAIYQAIGLKSIQRRWGVSAAPARA